MKLGILHDWSAKRSGAAITITHSTGRISGVAEITVKDGALVAIGISGDWYELTVKQEG